MNALLFLVAFFAVTACIEFYVLRRWFCHWGLAACVGRVSLPVGFVSMVVMVISAWIGSRAKAATEGPLTALDLFVDFVVGPLIWTLILTAIAAVPAACTAFIYQRFWSKL